MEFPAGVLNEAAVFVQVGLHFSWDFMKNCKFIIFLS